MTLTMISISQAVAMAKKHGVPSQYIYRIIQGNQIYSLGNGKKRLVSYRDIEQAILSRSNRIGIMSVFAEEWNMVVQRAITRFIMHSKSEGLWGEHFYTPRHKGRISILTIKDVLDLQPRYNFFAYHEQNICTIVSNDTQIAFKKFLCNLNKEVKTYINKKLVNKLNRKLILEIEYEELLYAMLDRVLIGFTMDDAYAYALTENGHKKEHTSEKECHISNYALDAVIAASSDYVQQYSEFEQASKKFRASLLERRLKYRESSPEAFRDAESVVEKDLAIFECIVEGLSNNEIKYELGLACSRQRIAQIRESLLSIARETFGEFLTK